MEDQGRLFDGAVESVVFRARFVPGEGWRVALQIRRQFEDWTDARHEEYERLTTDELLEVLDVSLGSLVAALGG